MLECTMLNGLTPWFKYNHYQEIFNIGINQWIFVYNGIII